MQQLADKAALPEKRLCYRNRAPVCFQTAKAQSVGSLRRSHTSGVGGEAAHLLVHGGRVRSGGSIYEK